MLILSRTRNEDTVVVVPPSTEPTTIVMRCVDIRGDRVRSGWTAARNVEINRSEIHEIRQAEKGKP